MTRNEAKRLGLPGRRNSRACLIILAGAWLLLPSGCRSEYEILDTCDCTEPVSGDPANGNEGDQHQSFDFEVKDLTATPSDGSPTIQELEDFDLGWSVEYHWNACSAILHVHAGGKTTAIPIGLSTPGTSGPATMRYSLTDATTLEVLLAGSTTADLRMGAEAPFSVPFEGATVPTTDLATQRLLTFEVTIDAEPGQECPDDLTNSGILQGIVVLNCPCANGDKVNDLHPADLAWDPVATTLSWYDDYAWVRCGREEDELTDMAAGFTETVTVWTFDGAEQFNGSRVPALAVPLNDRVLSEWVLDTAAWAPPPYVMQIELSALPAGTDCQATASKIAQIIVH